MADGTPPQRGFHFPHKKLISALRPGEIVMDYFAGGGGASEALEQALGRPVDIAINHDEWAIGMHAANHPFTQHLRDDVWHANPVRLAAGRPVGWAHFSPDCTHFSQAKGGQPRKRAVRGLAWVAVKCIGMLAKHGCAPRIISLENVRQMLGWCPLIARRCRKTGRVVRLDGTVAAPGERVPVQLQWLIPDTRRLGETWRAFVAALRSFGYVVEWRILNARDYGSGSGKTGKLVSAAPIPTIPTRDRFGVFEPVLMGVHGTARAKSVDESSVPTITTGGAANTDRPGCARPQLFEPIVVATCNSGSRGVRLASDPLRTITTARGGDQAVAEPIIVHRQTSVGGRGARSTSEPVPTIATAGGGYLAEPVLMEYRIDILYRMLFERELYNAQGFPRTYIINRTADGRRLTRTQAVRMVGNSVSPPPFVALARANLDPVPQQVAA